MNATSWMVIIYAIKRRMDYWKFTCSLVRNNAVDYSCLTVMALAVAPVF